MPRQGDMTTTSTVRTPSGSLSRPRGSATFRRSAIMRHLGNALRCEPMMELIGLVGIAILVVLAGIAVLGILGLLDE